MALLNEQIACVQRELRMREKVYPHRVAAKRMSQATARSEILLMQAVLETLLALKAEETLL